jgi:hypothetical protein
MSHLGESLSALVDEELSGADRDRVVAHLASCEECRAEAAALRDLKRQLRGLAIGPEALADAPDDAEMVSRLVAMAGPGGPVPPRHRPHGRPDPRAAFRSYPVPSRARSRDRGRPGPVPGRPGAPRRRYVVAGAVSLMVVGLGVAAFSVGGSAAGTPGPRITPPVEVYSVEHAITTGEVPYPTSSPQP